MTDIDIVERLRRLAQANAEVARIKFGDKAITAEQRIEGEAATLISQLRNRKEVAGEILAELLDFLKLHKAQFYQPGWTNRDRDELMAIMHKGNAVALSASPSPPIPAVEIDGEKR